MGTDTGLMSACTPKAKCNYMLSQATIKKEGSCEQPFIVDGHAVKCICRTGGERRDTKREGGGIKLIMREME